MVGCKRGQRGFATLFVLLLGASAVLALSAALRMHYSLHDMTKALMRDVQTKAATITLVREGR